MYTYRIEDEDREFVGSINIDGNKIEEIFDLALTPIVEIPGVDDQEDTESDFEADATEPKIASFLLSRRTTLDTRPREEEPPYDYIGEPSLMAAEAQQEEGTKEEEKGDDKPKNTGRRSRSK